jgi:flagella basal body P-ring formation protein FlgA
VTVRILSEVVVASRPIYRGQLISESDIAVQQSDLTQLPAGVFLRAEDVIGKTAKSSIGGGMALFPALLRATQVVDQGDTVRLAYAGDGFEVNSSGRALTAGGVGEEVEVRSVSGRVLKGVVKDKGLVWVR